MPEEYDKAPQQRGIAIVGYSRPEKCHRGALKRSVPQKAMEANPHSPLMERKLCGLVTATAGQSPTTSTSLAGKAGPKPSQSFHVCNT
jgi:hypothetical protein